MTHPSITLRRAAPFALLLLTACNQGTAPGAAGTAGDATSARAAFTAIRADEGLSFAGTEPFWGGSVSAGRLTYTTPENPAGQTIPVTRFAGNNGLNFSGTLGGQPFDLAVSKSPCSDGMSDRRYPFSVTLQVAGEMRSGCAWTARMPFTGAE